MTKFHQLRVSEVKRDTNDATTIAFDLPSQYYEMFNYKAGQYVTLKFNLNNNDVRRSYSLCSSPVLEEPLRIGVKRVKNGLVSNHINDNVKVGDIVDVMPPNGNFFVNTNKEHYKTYYLFSAGSGITPILSILKTVLHTEKRSYVYMIYGNRNQDSIMFKDELEKLQYQYHDRFVLTHMFSRPKSNWSDLWKSSKSQPFKKGRIDLKAIEWFVNTYPPYAQNAEYYICGPGTMIENTKSALKRIDVPDERIFMEHFGASDSEKHVEAFENAHLTARLDGETIQVKVPKGTTLLRALINAGKEPPYSCEGGICASCICKLNAGRVHMKTNLTLSDTEVEQGHILSCQSIPLSEKIEITY